MALALASSVAGIIATLPTLYAVTLITLLAALALLAALRLSPVEVLIISLPFSFHTQFSGVTFNIFPSNLILLVLILSLLATSKGVTSAIGPIGLWILALTMVAAFGLLIAVLFRPYRADSVYGVAGILKLWVAAGYLGAVALALKRGGSEVRTRVARLWVFVSALIAGPTLLASALHQLGTPIPALGFLLTDYRAQGTFTDPNAYALYLGLSIGCAIFLRHTTHSRMSLPLIALFAVTVLLTGSRAALPALLIATLVLILSSKHPRPQAALGWMFAALVTWALIANEVGPFGSDVQSVQRVLSGSTVGVEGDPRFLLWPAALETWSENALLGVGLGQFRAYTGLDQIPHNTYLTFLVELGLLGFLAWVWVPALVALRVFRAQRHHVATAPGLLFGLCVLAAEAGTFNIENQPAVWCFIGFALASTPPTSTDSSPKQTSEEVVAVDNQ